MKRIVNIVLVLLFLSITLILGGTAVFAESPDGGELYLGDVNSNGDIDVGDAIHVLKNIAGLDVLDGEKLQKADVNLSGRVDVIDAVLLLRKAACLIDNIPISDPAVVSTERALRYALAHTDAGVIRLAANIALSSLLEVGRPVTLDGQGGALASHTINGDIEVAAAGVVFSNIAVEGTVTLVDEAAALEGRFMPAEADGGAGDLTLDNATIGVLRINSANATVYIGGGSAIAMAYIYADTTIYGSGSIAALYLAKGVVVSYPDGQEPGLVSLNPHFWVNPETDMVCGFDWGSKADLTITINDGVACGDTITADEDGNFFWVPEGCDIQPGDSVEVSDGVTVKTHVVTAVMITEVDREGHWVSGTAAADSLVEVILVEWIPGSGPVFIYNDSVSADPEGNWVVDFGAAGYTIHHREVRAVQSDDDGDCTTISREAPSEPIRIQPGDVFVGIYDGTNVPFEHEFQLFLGEQEFVETLGAGHFELGGVFTGAGITGASLSIIDVARAADNYNEATLKITGFLNISQEDWDELHREDRRPEGTITLLPEGHSGEEPLTASVFITQPPLPMDVHPWDVCAEVYDGETDVRVDWDLEVSLGYDDFVEELLPEHFALEDALIESAYGADLAVTAVERRHDRHAVIRVSGRLNITEEQFKEHDGSMSGSITLLAAGHSGENDYTAEIRVFPPPPGAWVQPDWIQVDLYDGEQDVNIDLTFDLELGYEGFLPGVGPADFALSEKFEGLALDFVRRDHDRRVILRVSGILNISAADWVAHWMDEGQGAPLIATITALDTGHSGGGDLIAEIRLQPHEYVPFPRINVDWMGDGIWGHDWPAGGTLTVTVGNLEDPDFRGTAQADEWGNFDLWDLDGFDIAAGDLVRVACGDLIKEHTVRNLAITSVDLEADTVSGTAEPGSRVWVDNCADPRFGREAFADENGNWSVDFSVPVGPDPEDGIFDIVPGFTMGAEQRDSDDDATRVHWRIGNPFFNVNPQDDGIWGHDWLPGEEITVAITGGDGFEAYLAADAEGNFELWELDGFDIEVGYTVTVVQGAITRTHTVRYLEITAVDSAADTISGKAEPGSPVRVSVHGHEAPERYVHAGEDGSWTADFSTAAGEEPRDQAYDIAPGSEGYVCAHDEAGNATFANWFALNPHFWVNPETDMVCGFEWGSKADLTITINDGVACGDTITADEDGNFFWVFEGCDIQPGDSVEVSDGVTVKTHVVTAVMITEVDREGHWVSGTAAADSLVEVILVEWIPGSGPDSISVPADPEGNWVVDFGAAGYTIHHREVRAVQSDDDGDYTMISREAPREPIRIQPGDVFVDTYEGTNVPFDHEFQLFLGDQEFVETLGAGHFELGGVFTGAGITGASLSISDVARAADNYNEATLKITGFLNISQEDWDELHRENKQPEGTITLLPEGNSGGKSLTAAVFISQPPLPINVHPWDVWAEVYGGETDVRVDWDLDVFLGYDDFVEGLLPEHFALDGALIESAYGADLSVTAVERRHDRHAVIKISGIMNISEADWDELHREGRRPEGTITLLPEGNSGGKSLDAAVFISQPPLPINVHPWDVWAEVYGGETDVHVDWDLDVSLGYDDFVEELLPEHFALEDALIESAYGADLAVTVVERRHDRHAVIRVSGRLNITEEQFKEHDGSMSGSITLLAAGHSGENDYTAEIRVSPPPPGAWVQPDWIQVDLYDGGQDVNIDLTFDLELGYDDFLPGVGPADFALGKKFEGLTLDFVRRDHDRRVILRVSGILNISAADWLAHWMDEGQGAPLIATITALDTGHSGGEDLIAEIRLQPHEYVPFPRINVDWMGDGIWGHDWPAGGTLTVTVGNLDDPDFRGTAQVDEWGNFDLWDLDGFDIAAGDLVRVACGDLIKEHTVRNLAITSVDLEADTVSGTAEPGSKVWVDNCADPRFGREAFADENGNWSVDFSVPVGPEPEDGIFDIVPGLTMAAEQRDSDDDATRVNWRITNPFFHVNPQDDGIWGHEWAPGEELTVTIEGEPGFSATVCADEWGNFELWDLKGFDLEVGHAVTVTQGAISRVHEVRYLQITAIDFGADTISGRADPGSLVWVEVHGLDFYERFVQAGEDGCWTADFSVATGEDPWDQPCDLLPGSHGCARVNDDAGNATFANW